ncbi:MAG: hypothetical protein GY863_03980 [bacterium]|nr:hypothetical protein [bacterium]
MKCQYTIRLLILFIFYSFINCSQNENFPELTGSYLGQKPPGMIPEVFAPGIISTGAADQNGIFDPEGKEFYFTLVVNREYIGFTMKETGARWSEPEISFFQKDLNGGEPFISPDGKRLFFGSDGDIWFSEMTGNEWGKPVKIGLPVSMGSIESYPTVSENGNLYFYSNRDEAIGGFDIFMSELNDGRYNEIYNLGEKINSAGNEFNPCISPNEEYIIFNSPNRPDGFGGHDLYISFRDNNTGWTEAVNMGKLFNTSGSEYSAHITANGKYIFFSSTRSILDSDQIRSLSFTKFRSAQNSWGNGNPDIYWVDAKVIEELRPDK